QQARRPTNPRQRTARREDSSSCQVSYLGKNIFDSRRSGHPQLQWGLVSHILWFVDRPISTDSCGGLFLFSSKSLDFSQRTVNSSRQLRRAFLVLSSHSLDISV